MHFIYLCLIFLFDLIIKFTNGITENRSNSQIFSWSCYLKSQRRLECRNLFNFYFSSYTLCGNDNRLLIRQNIDELYIYNDYNCFDHLYQCYFEFDSTWLICLNSLKKLVIENLSFIIRNNDDSKNKISIDYLKIVNTHGSITEMFKFFQFSNRSSIYIQNPHPRWSGMDLYAIYSQYSSVRFKQLWINVLDWYPIIYLRYDQQIAIQQWLRQIPCLHIELGDCRSYHYDMIYLRDVFDLRQENSNELYCTINQNTEHSHWTQVPALNYNYKKPIRTLSKLLSLKELQENCFDQFTKKQYTINSYTDLQEFYSYFHIYESYTIPLWTIYPYATLPNLPISSTRKTSTILFNNQSIYPSKIDYINIYEYGLLFNQTRWLSSIETYPDGRFIIIDNRNQQLLLLNENGTYIIDLTTIYFHQIQLKIHEQYSQSTINNAYSYSQIYIDQDGYSYLISKLAYFIYIFTPDNRLIRYLTPQLLSISIIRSDCLAITYTGLIYICDDTYRVIRIYTRMGVPQRTIRLNYLPLKLFIRNNRLFTYSMEQTANIQMYTLLGIHIRTLSMCSYRLPTEVVWFRGKYFLTCGIYLFVLDEQGEQIAEHSLHTLLDYSNTSLIINDFALNKNGLFLVIFRRNGTLFNRYWIIRPTTV
ncbi:unnamed protein product [Rotaria sp. Silwood1]|nr:unnamed protein product [Rotaria sp. Silwood1]